MLPQVKKWSGKKSSRSGEVREFDYESEKTDILKKSQGKLKLFNTADLILLTARGCIWGHCDLLKTYQSYERMEEEAVTRPDLLHFFSFDEGKVREKSGNFEKGCLWQPYILHKEYPVWFLVDALHPLCHRMCKVTKEFSGANNIMRNAIDSTSITFRWTFE